MKSSMFSLNRIIGIVQIILLIVLIFFIVDLGKQFEKMDRKIAGIATPAPSGPEKVQLENNPNVPFMGADTAKVQMVVFSDFQCSYCKTFAVETLPRLEEEYVKKGLLQVHFRNLPLDIHEEAVMAAETAACANEQGKFWEMHHVLFNNMELLNRDFFYQTAANIGLDKKGFEDCLDTQKFKNHVQNDIKEAHAVGITGTPTIIINGNVILGSMPYENFKDMIEAELAKG